MNKSGSSSSCPGCGAPIGAGSACEYCGAALPLGARPAPPAQSFSSAPSESPARPSAPPAQPFSPPPPSGLEPFALGLGEAFKGGRGALKGLAPACLGGCLSAVLAFVGCGIISWLISSQVLMPRGQGSPAISGALVLLSLLAALGAGVVVTVVMLIRRARRIF